jgi:flagellar hook-basal body complex protein FliE
MRIPITSVAPSAGAEFGQGSASDVATGVSFSDAFDAAIRAVDAQQKDADVMMRGLATGENVDIHGTMIALEEANISLRALGSVRDKMVEAYQSIWNMPI